MKKRITTELFTINNELIIEHDLTTKIAKKLANIKRIDELEYDMYANVILNDNIVEATKYFMQLRNIDKATLYITNDYAETVDEIKISL